MYCYRCGSKISDGDKFCNNCGEKILQPDEVERRISHLETVEADGGSGSIGWTILGFFLPIVGLILFLVWLRKEPNNSNAAGAGVLAAVFVWFVVPCILFPVF